MKLLFYIILLFSINLNAQNLKEILDSLDRSSKAKSINLNRDAQIAENSLITTYSAPLLGVSLSHAKDPIDQGFEYSVGISHELSNPFSNDTKRTVGSNLSKAATQEAKYELRLIELDVASKYHTACTSKELQTRAESLFKEQKGRVSQLKKAYDLGEISRKDLLFNKLDLAKLNRNISIYKREYSQEFLSLQESLENLELTTLTCDDLFKPSDDINIRDISEHSELKRLSYKVNAAKSLSSMYNTAFETIGYEFVYEQELETRRYTAGLSIPIGGISSQKELLKKQELLMSSSYEFEKVSLKSKIEKGSKRLLRETNALFEEFKLLKDEILPLNEELLKLSKSAHEEGEGSVMEYLDASRSYSENVLEMLEIKKTYYQELFEFYKIADMEYGE